MGRWLHHPASNWSISRSAEIPCVWPASQADNISCQGPPFTGERNELRAQRLKLRGVACPGQERTWKHAKRHSAGFFCSGSNPRLCLFGIGLGNVVTPIFPPSLEILMSDYSNMRPSSTMFKGQPAGGLQHCQKYRQRWRPHEMPRCVSGQEPESDSAPEGREAAAAALSAPRQAATCHR